MPVGLILALSLFACGYATLAVADNRQATDPDESLRDTKHGLEEALVAAFNACNLDDWRLYLAADIEFCQDNDEVTTTRRELEPSFRDRCDSDEHRP